MLENVVAALKQLHLRHFYQLVDIMNPSECFKTLHEEEPFESGTMAVYRCNLYSQVNHARQKQRPRTKSYPNTHLLEQVCAATKMQKVDEPILWGAPFY